MTLFCRDGKIEELSNSDRLSYRVLFFKKGEKKKKACWVSDWWCELLSRDEQSF